MNEGGLIILSPLAKLFVSKNNLTLVFYFQWYPRQYHNLYQNNRESIYLESDKLAQ
jgi:hypothetical protein